MSPRIRRRVVVLFLALSTALVACSTPAAPPSSAPPPTPAATPSPSIEPSPPATAFPVTVTDDEATAVVLASEPQKIVSLTPATTEILFEIGAGDRVVATDDGSDYPEAAVPLPDVASFSSVDVEKVVSLAPDLVVAGGLGFSPPEAIAKLRTLKIPVLVLYSASVDGVYHDIELVGTAVGDGPAATSLTAAMRTEIGAISQSAKGAGTPPRVYYEVGYTDATGQIFAPADQSFVAEMVTLAGGDAITTDDPASYEIPLEMLIERDPQVIILGVNPFYKPTPAQVAKRPGWSVMTAVKDGQIRPVQDTEITRPGPRLATGLRNLVAAIWPDLALPSGPSGP